jgi:DNA-binding MarR family transcriptional regulator
MLEKGQVWTLAQETMRAFQPFYWREMRQAIADSGAPDNWFSLNVARGCDPAPLAVDRYEAMSPYTARQVFVDRLEGLARVELLERVGEDVYRLTDLGRGAVEGIFGAAHRSLEAVEPLPAGEMARLNALLGRIVEATLEAPEPQEKWAITYSRWTDPGEGVLGAAKADQYLTDLNRYRDDAHLAAWRPYDVSGQAWEALTFVWRDEAHTAEELTEKLPYRSHTAQDYRQALEELAHRGWVVEEAGAFELSEEGRRVREAAEEATDRHFFVGWAALGEDELDELQDLLARARDNLRAAAERRAWELLRELSGAIPTSVRDYTAPLMADYGLDTAGFFALVLTAQRLLPDPISVARLKKRDPYSNPTRYSDILAKMAEVSFFKPTGEGEYEVSAKGRTGLQFVNHAFYTRLGEMSSLPEEQLEQAEGLLRKIADASLEAKEPEGKWCLLTTRHGLPAEEYSPLARIDQRLDELNAYRDDAHLAAWKPCGVGGPAWEAFTTVWRGEASTPEALAEQLTYRAHTAETYAEALADLASRGWVEKTADGYQVTEKGRNVRQQAEDATDRYFFSPWTCLSSVELAQLQDTLGRLKDRLQEAGEGGADAA